MPMFGGPLALVLFADVVFYFFIRWNSGADIPAPRAIFDGCYAAGEIEEKCDQINANWLRKACSY